MVTYIGALINSLITTTSVQMRRAVNKIVDFCTGLLARVISRVKSMMDPLVNRKPGSSTEKPAAPEQPKKDDSNNKSPSLEDPVEIKPFSTLALCVE
ncbi:hypothetical protein KEM54_005220 [Ascosphaera aggregata]|nr:hypothetical protein KEM54_005220 [Ascosphaera aggregata]